MVFLQCLKWFIRVRGKKWQNLRKVFQNRPNLFKLNSYISETVMVCCMESSRRILRSFRPEKPLVLAIYTNIEVSRTSGNTSEFWYVSRPVIEANASNFSRPFPVCIAYSFHNNNKINESLLMDKVNKWGRGSSVDSDVRVQTSIDPTPQIEPNWTTLATASLRWPTKKN